MYNQSERIVFLFKNLKYEVFQGKWVPIGFPYIDRLDQLIHTEILKAGLDE
jgi:hypothetical protein